MCLWHNFHLEGASVSDNRIIAQSMPYSSLPHIVFPQGELFMAFQAILAYSGRLRTIPCGGQLHFEHIESILVALKRGDLTCSYYKEWKQTSLNHKLKSPYYIVTGTFQTRPIWVTHTHITCSINRLRLSEHTGARWKWPVICRGYDNTQVQHLVQKWKNGTRYRRLIWRALNTEIVCTEIAFGVSFSPKNRNPRCRSKWS